MKAYLLAISAANVAGLVSTLWFTNRVGWQTEGNPVLRWYFQNLGLPFAIAIKIGGGLLVAAILYWACKQVRATWFAWLFVLLFALTAIWNVYNVYPITH